MDKEACLHHGFFLSFDNRNGKQPVAKKQEPTINRIIQSLKFIGNISLFYIFILV
ncbi:hypothetical protein HMPREF0083_04150 [Aneurinibacillus aneurinilyticus ATCC 12856]|uniref:Uncharacterized protein n=1 Tax=Aneurinibacillus aneurinilyticus ATCC 12856 TaxID=649747 RepID=U1WZV3_ANEAE|nr:hypothetical protein HMPREF0083_04150 [Aneurinibacillus aneurinilyticus ATCC 12856]